MYPQFLFTLDTHRWINVAAVVKTTELRRTKNKQALEYYRVTLTDGSEHAVCAEQFDGYAVGAGTLFERDYGKALDEKYPDPE